MNVRAVHQASTLPADEKIFSHFRPAHESSLGSIFRSWCVCQGFHPPLWRTYCCIGSKVISNLNSLGPTTTNTYVTTGTPRVSASSPTEIYIQQHFSSGWNVNKLNIMGSWISKVKTMWTLNCSVARRALLPLFVVATIRPKVKLVFAAPPSSTTLCLSYHKSLAAATFSHCIDTRHTWFRKRLLLLSLFIYSTDADDDCDADYACLLVE